MEESNGSRWNSIVFEFKVRKHFRVARKFQNPRLYHLNAMNIFSPLLAGLIADNSFFRISIPSPWFLHRVAFSVCRWMPVARQAMSNVSPLSLLKLERITYKNAHVIPRTLFICKKLNQDTRTYILESKIWHDLN